MRQQVYRHVEQYLKPGSKILELNAGTGIDALHFVKAGHHVHATDVSAGMIEQLRKKSSDVADALSFQHVSYTELDKVTRKDFDYIFSNFGGLNCIPDLKEVTKHFTQLLKPGSYITLVIMPIVCPWEIAGAFRNGKKALRRFRPQGVLAHLEGEYFQTYYHSLRDIRKAFDTRYIFLESEGLAPLSPQPHSITFPRKNPRLDKFLTQLDKHVRNRFPFNQWADHIIVTFQYAP